MIVPRRARPSRSQRGIVVHTATRPIPETDITIIYGIRLTKPARTLLDLAATEPPTIVERCLDDALRRNLVSLRFLRRWLEDPHRTHARGAPLLRGLTKAHVATGGGTPLEKAFLRFLADRHLPVPHREYKVYDGSRFIGRVDFAYPQARVAIEADSFRFHDRRDRFDDERARGNDLLALGWQVLRVTSAHLDDNPQQVERWIKRAMRA